MDWTPKTLFQWDWESFAPFNGKESEISRSAHVSDWKVECSLEINNGSLYPSSNGACSGSEVGSRSSNSSFSASDDSLAKAERQRSELNFGSHEKFPENLNKAKAKTKIEFAEASPLLAPKEPLIGLKLGKRTYIENASSLGNTTNSLASKNISSTLIKTTRVYQHSTQSYFCQVQGCNFDLSSAKEYHRKHRVCVNHSKSPKVVVDGQERRFCQQCSRFHALSEFDEKKRSCRRRLSDHNARRRKPPPEIIAFSSLLPFNDNRRQMNLAFSHDRFSNATIMANSTWDGFAGFKLTQPSGSWIKSDSDTRLQFPTIGLSNNMSTLHHDLDKLLPFKGTTAEVLNQEASFDDRNSDGGPVRHARSLLSNYSWGSSNLRPFSNAQALSTNDMITAHPAIHAGTVTTGFWQADQTVAETLPFNLWKNEDHLRE